MRLDDPELVLREYARDERLAARMHVYRELAEGPSAEETLIAEVAATSPRRVLEVGCGTGELAARIVRDVGAEVVALDVSPHMIDAARGRGVEARVGDVQALPFASGSFDCAVAAWMLYHVPDLDGGLAELRRILRPAGRLVAATFSEDNMRELWELVGPEALGAGRGASFTRENGRDVLLRFFTTVARHDLDRPVTLPDAAAARSFAAATIRRRHLADQIPELDGPLRAVSRHSVFVAWE
jgi:SAM-dependent methyltransferase